MRRRILPDKKEGEYTVGKLSFGKDPQKHHRTLNRIRTVSAWIFQITVVCLFAFVFVWYFGQRISNVGDSMEPVLKNGNVVLVNRIVYDAKNPKRGEIIAFKPNGNENSHYYIKRIIGLPGETVQIQEGNILVNGKKLEEKYKTTQIQDAGIAGDPVELKKDEYFVLGDNRMSSEDSRNANVGIVKRSYIEGRIWFIVGPMKEFGFLKES